MNRITWIDNLRGLSILAVIFLHCTIAVNGHTGHFGGLSTLINTLLQPMRLGLMFFVSGLFVESGLRKGMRLFLRNKIQSILYPFVVWVAIYGGIKIFFSHYSNHPQSPLAILLSHLTGGGDITWFLHSLFLFFMVIIPLRRIAFYWVILGCMLLSWRLPAIPEGFFSSFDNMHINKSIYLFMFFYLGDFLIRKKVDILQFCQKESLKAVSLAAFIALSCLNIFIEQKIAPSLLAPLALLAIPLFICVAVKIKHPMIFYIGQNSIVFYLVHYLVIQLFAKVLRSGDESMLMSDLKFMLAFASALTVPLLVCWLRKRGWLNFLFTAKRSVKIPVPAQ
ncbi:acyltransferase [Erwinia endophytica]|uniref:acyltransferase family protein n=1 Tax=Erwinia endophytica TaxID=1563158 RepID=UPI001265F281|nr:acyltransferase [Erwinia endophytica]KAB8306260.1 acyltransferase [Erwinia endophytica]